MKNFEMGNFKKNQGAPLIFKNLTADIANLNAYPHGQPYIHLNFRAGSTYLVPLCTIPSSGVDSPLQQG